MNRVFIIEQPKVSTDGLQSYGELNVLFPSGQRRSSVLRCDLFMQDVVRRLREVRFDPEVDRFCITPPLLTTSLALSALVMYCGQSPLHLVVFNASTGGYEERRVNLETVCTQH